MFRLWGKIIKDSKIIKDHIAFDYDYSKSRTDMILNALTDICHNFDLAKPIWLKANIDDFKSHNKTRFINDNFIEAIDFDYLEIQIIEE